MNARRLVCGVFLLLAACPGNKDGGPISPVNPTNGTPLPDGGTRLPDGALLGDGDYGDGDGDGLPGADGGPIDPTVPVVIDDCKTGAAGLTDGQIAALKAGGNASDLRML